VSVYLDWNATAPPLPEVIEAMARAARETWGNPQSVHAHGRAARSIVEDARQAVAELANVDARDVTFTSGGTEANNLAISSWMQGGGVLLMSKIEHPSVTRLSERFNTRWIPTTEDGRIDVYQMEMDMAHNGDVTCVCVQAVNQETGVIQPVREAIELAHKYSARIHVDARSRRPGTAPTRAALPRTKRADPRASGR
jgi:cysteine desulfurase